MPKGKALPSARYLHECLYYDAASGLVSWKDRPERHFKTKAAFHGWNRRYAGTIAGWNDGARYVGINLNKKGYLLHRIIWKMMTGKNPRYEIDHKDGNPLNNRWPNLREATATQNLFNKRVRFDSATGVKGVRIASHQKTLRYTAYRSIPGSRHKQIGTFDTLEEAKAAVEAVTRIQHGEFFRSDVL
jgi:hypothetical protein